MDLVSNPEEYSIMTGDGASVEIPKVSDTREFLTCDLYGECRYRYGA